MILFFADVVSLNYITAAIKKHSSPEEEEKCFSL